MTSSSSSSSTFKPKLNDQEYLELVFENGHIQAKKQRSKLFSQRTKSIVDLYELEYNEDFKKSIKNHTYHHQVVPNHDDDDDDVAAESTNKKHVKKAKKMTSEFIIPADQQSVVAERSIGSGFDSFFSTGYTEVDSEGSSTDLSSSLDDDESDDNARPRLVPARTRKRRSKEVSKSSPESKQRNDIDKRMRTLQNLLPNSHKDDNESLLDETINYMTTLQHQVQMMTMNNRFVTTPSMMLPPLVVPHYSQMGMQMCVPQFLSHPGLVPMQDSMLFASVENYYSPQYVPPSYDIATYPNQVPNSTYTIDQETFKNLKTP